MMSFLRGGMKPITGDAAAFVAAEAAVSAPGVVVGFVLAAATPAAPEVCDAVEVVEEVLATVFPDDEPVSAVEPCVDFALVDGSFWVAVGAAFPVPSDAVAADDDAEPAGVDFTASAGDDDVADAAGFVSVAGFDAVCAVPELAGGVAVAVTAFTAC